MMLCNEPSGDGKPPCVSHEDLKQRFPSRLTNNVARKYLRSMQPET